MRGTRQSWGLWLMIFYKRTLKRDHRSDKFLRCHLSDRKQLNLFKSSSRIRELGRNPSYSRRICLLSPNSKPSRFRRKKRSHRSPSLPLSRGCSSKKRKRLKNSLRRWNLVLKMPSKIIILQMRKNFSSFIMTSIRALWELDRHKFSSRTRITIQTLMASSSNNSTHL